MPRTWSEGASTCPSASCSAHPAVPCPSGMEGFRTMFNKAPFAPFAPFARTEQSTCRCRAGALLEGRSVACRPAQPDRSTCHLSRTLPLARCSPAARNTRHAPAGPSTLYGGSNLGVRRPFDDDQAQPGLAGPCPSPAATHLRDTWVGCVVRQVRGTSVASDALRTFLGHQGRWGHGHVQTVF